MENTDKKNTYIAIAVVVVILALIAIPLMKKFRGGTAENNGADTNTDASRMAATTPGTFSGTISAVDTGCFADAVCSVTIDGKKIILVQGGRGLPPDTAVGRLIGVDSIGDLEQRMGAFANVYAGRTPEGDYTLYGSSEYYVEVVMISGK